MKSYLALAWKELKAQKITAILILVAVIMSTINRGDPVAQPADRWRLQV